MKIMGENIATSNRILLTLFTEVEPAHYLKDTIIRNPGRSTSIELGYSVVGVIVKRITAYE